MFAENNEFYCYQLGTKVAIIFIEKEYGDLLLLFDRHTLKKAS